METPPGTPRRWFPLRWARERPRNLRPREPPVYARQKGTTAPAGSPASYSAVQRCRYVSPKTGVQREPFRSRRLLLLKSIRIVAVPQSRPQAEAPVLGFAVGLPAREALCTEYEQEAQDHERNGENRPEHDQSLGRFRQTVLLHARAEVVCRGSCGRLVEREPYQSRRKVTYSSHERHSR